LAACLGIACAARVPREPRADAPGADPELRLSAPDEASRLDLARGLLARGESAAALALLRSERTAGGPQWQLLFATALRETGDLEAARRVFEELLRRDAESAAAHHGLARTLDRNRDFELAEVHYRRAVALEPRRADYANDLGFSRLAAGDWASAEAALRAALRVAPDHLAARRNLALCLGWQRRDGEALATLAEAWGRARALADLGAISELRGDLDLARAHYRAALDLDPSLPAPRVNRDRIGAEQASAVRKEQP
jgi:Flp pilus assembly protein TadD